jgi:hypothetical protein
MIEWLIKSEANRFNAGRLSLLGFRDLAGNQRGRKSWPEFRTSEIREQTERFLEFMAIHGQLHL